MRSLIIFITMVLMAVLVSSTPINPKRILINRPKEHQLLKRSAQVKGESHGIKGLPHLNLRKGEYMCGNKVCKLKTGEMPKGCNGVCQYPVGHFLE